VDELQPNKQLTAQYEKLYSIFNRAYDAFEPLFTDIASL
jgi:hypothetical protein